jgi:hypothetical protein
MRNRSRLWIFAVLLACVTGLGTHQLLASRPAADATQPEPAVTATTEACAAAAEVTAASAAIPATHATPAGPADTTLGAGGGKGCGDCPRTIGLKCRRVSCSPCCYECPDSQFPYCTS